MASPASGPPATSVNTPAGIPNSSSTSPAIFCTAIAVSGTADAGFQTTVSPQTAANIAFHAHTAAGKLNDEMTPMGPSGWYCSIMRWPGRSEAMVRPNRSREKPAA